MKMAIPFYSWRFFECTFWRTFTFVQSRAFTYEHCLKHPIEPDGMMEIWERERKQKTHTAKWSVWCKGMANTSHRYTFKRSIERMREIERETQAPDDIHTPLQSTTKNCNRYSYHILEASNGTRCESFSETQKRRLKRDDFANGSIELICSGWGVCVFLFSLDSTIWMEESKIKSGTAIRVCFWEEGESVARDCLIRSTFKRHFAVLLHHTTRTMA